MTNLMYDATRAELLPEHAWAVAGYVGPRAADNRFVDFAEVAARFHGRAHLLSIAAQPRLIAACLDIEAGDAKPRQAPGWFRMMKAHGQWRPCFYAPLDLMPAVTHELAADGISRREEYRLFVAHFDGRAVPVPGFDAKQYIDHGPNGENYDISIVNPGFFPSPLVPTRYAAEIEVDPTTGHWTIAGLPFNAPPLK